jgi:integrase
MRQKLTPAWVANVKPSGTNQIYWDTEQRGFGLLVLPSGERRYVVQYRAFRRSRRITFKPGLTLTEARKEAKAVLGAVAKGGDPMAERRRQEGAATNTLKAIAEEYFKREGDKLRSANARKATFERLIYPALGSRQIDTIKRSEIVRLLDKVEDERGPQMAHAALAFLSKLFNWHASRDDDFLTPIRRGMGRVKMKDTARDRILTDDELRALWRIAEATPAPYGHFARFLLLTGTRRNEAARMARDEVLPDGNWIIPAARMKAKQEHVLPLSDAARAILDNMPKLGPYVFTATGRGPITNFVEFKGRLNAEMLAALRKMAAEQGKDPDKVTLERWTIHDLRRTARSLMSRAKVPPDIAERVLAHTISGVRGVYDRYAYLEEKRHALKELAALIERIINPPAANVLPLRKGVPKVPG